MLSQWSAAAAAKMKLTALIATSLAAGGVGGAVALSHVSPTATTQIVRTADASATPDGSHPETSDAQGTDATDPESTDAQNPGTGTGDPGSSGYTLPPCPAGVRSHGDYVSSVAHSAPKGKHGEHGRWVSQAAHSDCGKTAGDSPTTDPESAGSGSGDGESGSSTPDGAPKHKTRDAKPGGSADTSAPSHGSGSGGHGHGHGKS